MARNPPHYLKTRKDRSSPWTIMEQGDEQAMLECIDDFCLTVKSTNTLEHAIFHLGKITRWWRGGKDITSTSRQAAPLIAAQKEAENDETHSRYQFLHKGKVAAECVALNEDVARCSLEAQTHGWDYDKLELREVAKNYGHHNYWIIINSANAPLKEYDTP